LDIQVEHLTKIYGTTPAVDDLSFEVDRGEIVGFLGPNGAGKTTTMRILTGFIPATSGRARIAGHDVFSESLEARRCIGYVPEGMPLYPEMRVREYLDFRARIRGLSRRERRRRLDEMMDRCDIRDVRRQLIGSLSKGYRQRVGLAEVLVADPPVFILDEPTIGLDPNQIREVRRIIRDLGGKQTVLLSTHILAEVEMVCDRVLIIVNGRLAHAGPVREGRRAGARLSVVVRGPRDRVQAVLREIEGVSAATWREDGPEGTLEVTVRNGHDVRGKVSRCIAENGWTLLEMHPEREGLEEMFIRLTTGEEA